MVIVTVCVTLVFVGVAFRSVLVPLRSVITIGITTLFVFGFAALTYVVSWALHLPVRGRVGSAHSCVRRMVTWSGCLSLAFAL